MSTFRISIEQFLANAAKKPPVAHYADKMQGCVTKGDYALCGAKLKGINLTDSTRLCRKCCEIAKRRSL